MKQRTVAKFHDLLSFKRVVLLVSSHQLLMTGVLKQNYIFFFQKSNFTSFFIIVLVIK